MLVAVGIPDARHRMRSWPHEFSGGMAQRVVIALALCNEPELLIADEPTTALDVTVQAQIISLLKRYSTRRHGAAVMLITHDMGVIAETADRVAVMYAGRIAEIGEVHELIRNPLHPYTQGLMAAIPTLAVRARRLIADSRRHASALDDAARMRVRPALSTGFRTLRRASAADRDWRSRRGVLAL